MDTPTYKEGLQDCTSTLHYILDCDRKFQKETGIEGGFIHSLTHDPLPCVDLGQISDIRNAIDKHHRGTSQFWFDPEERTCLFVAFEGKNGCGDFRKDDLKQALKILDILEKKTAGATIIEMVHDVLDDTSAWCFAFELK